jgi:glycosyltransferase involved in cell wall biosynthesis
VDAEGLEDFRTVTRRNSGLYRALDERVELAGTFTPRLPAWRLRGIQALSFAPQRDRWRRRAALSPRAFRASSALVEEELRRREGTFDVVLQLYGLFAPGRPEGGRRYAMYLDATIALTHREFPPAAPISDRAYEQWFELERKTYMHAARLFPMSAWAGRSLVEDYGVDPARVIVAGAGSNAVADELPARRWDEQVALFVGLDWERKGGSDLLGAWRSVRRALPQAELWIVGTPRAYAPEEPGVKWFGRLPHAEVSELYRRASVFVLPALFDPFPHVLREALGVGLPCISTATGGTAEIVSEGVDSLIVAPRDPEALAAALIELLGDPERAEAMGRAGHARICAEATWSRVADTITPELQAVARD